MTKASLIDNLREWLAGIAFAIYLRLIRMSKEEFWAEQDRQAREAIRAGGAGELVRAAEDVYQYFTDMMIEITLLAQPELKKRLLALHDAIVKFREGDPTNPETDAHSA